MELNLGFFKQTAIHYRTKMSKFAWAFCLAACTQEASAMRLTKVDNLTDKVQYDIPLVLHQVAYTPLEADSWEMGNVREFLGNNKNFRYEILTDIVKHETDINNKITLNSTAYLHAHFNSTITNAFEQLGLGAAKGDFLRYCVLYQEGGLYFDVDTKVVPDVIKAGLIEPQSDAALLYDKNMNVRQDFLAFSPRHEFLKKVIDEMVRRIEQRVPNIWLTTGPTLFTDVYLSEATGSRVFGSKFSTTKTWRQQVILKHGASFLRGKILDGGKVGVINRAGHNQVGGPHYHLGDGATPGLYVQRSFESVFPPTAGLYKGMSGA